jgi:hypothetical protein
MAGGHLTGLIGKVTLAEPTVQDVQFVLGKLADRLSNRSVRLARMILIQAVRNAIVDDLRRAFVSDRHQARPVTRTVAIAPGRYLRAEERR